MEKNTIKHQICENAIEIISKMLEWGHTAGGTVTTGPSLAPPKEFFSFVLC